MLHRLLFAVRKAHQFRVAPLWVTIIAVTLPGSPLSAYLVTDWQAESNSEGQYGYLRQIQWFQFVPNDFYATKSVWVFGEGDILLLDWVRFSSNLPFYIRFSFLDTNDVAALAQAPSLSARNALLASMRAGPLTQITSSTFSDQAGVYDNKWLPEILFGAETPEMTTLLDAKYGANTSMKMRAYSLKDHLALDAQIYPAAGNYIADPTLTVYFPGYEPGIPNPLDPNDNTKEGWNGVISMGKDPELWMNAQGLTADDLLLWENRRWAISFAWNTHLESDGINTESLETPENVGHENYVGFLTAPGAGSLGLLYRSLILINTEWSEVPMTGNCNVVSHSTGYYLARDFLHFAPNLWPGVTHSRYFAISPNLRGSGMIGGSLAGFGEQEYDCMDDMYRDNWHWNHGYRLNQCTRSLNSYNIPANLKTYVMLSYGDMQSGGTGGAFSTVPGDIGVVDYSNYQPALSGMGNIDDMEYGRRKRFVLYESLYNMRNDGGLLTKSELIPEWKNGGDDYLQSFSTQSTYVSVFGENVNLEAQQGGDDDESYRDDHSDLAQRMMAMRLILNGTQLDLTPESGHPQRVLYNVAAPGTVTFTWDRSPDQVTFDTMGHVGGQIYEVVRRIKGRNSLPNWTDKWWHRVALKRAGGSLGPFTADYRTFETIRSVNFGSPGHGEWLFTTVLPGQYMNVPCWLDGAFDTDASTTPERELYLRVLNGPLEGGIFKVTKVRDYVGIGYTNAGALGSPSTFMDRDGIRLQVEPNEAFAGLKPNASEAPPSPKTNYITLCGVAYEYHAPFYGTVPTVRGAVGSTSYYVNTMFPFCDPDEDNADKGTGHWFSVDFELDAPAASHETDTVAPLITFSDTLP